MDKLKLAHDYALEMAKQGMPLKSCKELGWKYADAMQAEAKEREDKARPDVLLTKDKDGNCLHFHREFGRKKCMDCGASLEEWQPDWSQAPDNAKYWAMDGCGQCNWYARKPEVCGNQWDFGRVIEQAHTGYGYQGNWQDSLRKRPEALCEVDWSIAPKNAFQWQMIDDEAYWRIEIMGGLDTEPAPSFGFTGTHIAERPHGF